MRILNNRERVLKLLNHQKPDRVPWFGDLDYWYHAEKLKGSLPQKYHGDGYFELNRDLGVGFYLQGYAPYNIKFNKVKIDETRDGNKLIRIMKTPKGELTEIQQFLPISFSYGCVKHFVKTYDDLIAFRSFLEDISFEPNYGQAVYRKKVVGDNGIILCYTPRSPFMEMVTTYIGIENLVYLLADFPDEMDEILQLMERKHDVAAQITIDSPAECIMIPENLSSEVVGEYYYKKYMRPYEKKWIEKIRIAGKYSFIHMDGTLKGLIRQVAETGFDVIEAVTPFPSGDLTMQEVAGIVPDSTIIWGGVPGIMFTPSVTDEEFVEHVKDVLSIMKKHPRFVLGVADQVPPDGMIERIAKVSEICDRYGKY